MDIGTRSDLAILLESHPSAASPVRCVVRPNGDVAEASLGLPSPPNAGRCWHEVGRVRSPRVRAPPQQRLVPCGRFSGWSAWVERTGARWTGPRSALFARNFIRFARERTVSREYVARARRERFSACVHSLWLAPPGSRCYTGRTGRGRESRLEQQLQRSE